jgi:hypothetical protein
MRGGKGKVGRDRGLYRKRKWSHASASEANVRQT